MKVGAEKGLEVGDDFSILLDFKPRWMRMEPWKQLIDIWNTESWKSKSKRNASNRKKSTSKHTLRSQTLVTAKLRAEKELGRDISWEEMWESHCKKGKRPLDKLSEVGSSVVDDLDLEENVQQHKDEWVDERSYETLEIYKGYLMEKYGEDEGQHPRFDEPLWSRATRATGGKNKGKLYGLSNISDPLCFITGTPSSSYNSTSYGHGRQDPEIQRLNKILEELVKEKEREKAEKEKEKSEKEKKKTEKETMLERMTSIEAMLRLMTKNLPSSS